MLSAERGTKSGDKNKSKKKLCISAMMANGVVEGKPIVWPGVSPPRASPQLRNPQSPEMDVSPSFLFLVWREVWP